MESRKKKDKLLSFAPLLFEEAVTDILKIKPEPKPPNKKVKTKRKKRKAH